MPVGCTTFSLSIPFSSARRGHFQQRGICERRRPRAFPREGERGLLPQPQSEHRAGDSLTFRVEISPEPARLQNPIGRRGRLPDVRRPKCERDGFG